MEIGLSQVDDIKATTTFRKDLLITSRNFKDNNSKYMPSTNGVGV